jgi:hypothetical protein
MKSKGKSTKKSLFDLIKEGDKARKEDGHPPCLQFTELTHEETSAFDLKSSIKHGQLEVRLDLSFLIY